MAAMVARIFIALVLGALGFLTGMIAVEVFSELPGVPIPNGTSLWVGIGMGAACLVAGFACGDKTLDFLGGLWRVLWELSIGILSSIRALIR
jgi:hypothetical protein